MGGFGALPRPGRALKAVLGTIAGFAIAGFLLQAWGPEGWGARIYQALALRPGDVLHTPWTILTSGVLTSSLSFNHVLWSLVGLYFLTPDLEKRWGGAKLLRFLAASIVIANLFVLGLDRLPIKLDVLHPAQVFGPLAAVTAISMAWAKQNQHAQIRFMFFVPMSGRTLYWATIVLALVPIVFRQELPEGAFAPLGGVVAGVLLGGSPSLVRSAWLGLKLKLLRRQSEKLMTDLEGPSSSPRRVGEKSPKRGAKSPPLRIVQGGLEDELKNRKPPKDKRYLN
jgi:membrane associated rhomboid family serine protease